MYIRGFTFGQPENHNIRKFSKNVSILQSLAELIDAPLRFNEFHDSKDAKQFPAASVLNLIDSKKRIYPK